MFNSQRCLRVLYFFEPDLRVSKENPSDCKSSYLSAVMVELQPDLHNLNCLRWHLVHAAREGLSGLFDGTLQCPVLFLKALSSFSFVCHAEAWECHTKPMESNCSMRCAVMVEVGSLSSNFLY